MLSSDEELLFEDEYADEDEVDDAIIPLCVAFGIEGRSERVFRTRLMCNSHVDLLVRENKFQRSYRMPKLAYAKLTDMLSPSLSVDHDMSFVSSAGYSRPIIPELFLHCYMRYIAGGSYLDVRLIAQISVASFYRCLHTCIKAIACCPSLAIEFRNDPASLRRQRQQFQSLSSHDVIRGCVGCLDGILIGIKAPSLRDVRNPRDFWSGHYHRYGLNVPAMCNHAYRFTWIGVNGPGGMSDNTNYAMSSLSENVESLPTGIHINSDNAFDPDRVLRVENDRE